MAGIDKNKKAQISIEMAQDAEEFIRNLVREEIKKFLQEETRSRGWKPVQNWPPYEHKGEVSK